MKTRIIILLIIIVIETKAMAPIQLSDAYTAGLLSKQRARVQSMLFSDGGMLMGLDVGIFSKMSIGFSYGGKNIIGEEKIDWNDNVELSLKIRLLEEDYSRPAIAIGYNSQGFGKYFESLERYEIKSKGFYGVLSKNYAFWGNLGFHLGANYSLENKKDEDIDFYLGFDKDITKNFYFSLEYDFGINDDEKGVLGRGRGFLNFKADYSIMDYVELELILMDILKNYRYRENPARCLRINYYFDY